jgi:hypothetical protein
MEEENGFRKGRSRIESVFTVTQLTEKRKTFDNLTSRPIVFIYYITAFDKTWRKANYGNS